MHPNMIMWSNIFLHLHGASITMVKKVQHLTTTDMTNKSLIMVVPFWSLPVHASWDCKGNKHMSTLSLYNCNLKSHKRKCMCMCINCKQLQICIWDIQKQSHHTSFFLKLNATPTELMVLSQACPWWISNSVAKNTSNNGTVPPPTSSNAACVEFFQTFLHQDLYTRNSWIPEA